MIPFDEKAEREVLAEWICNPTFQEAWTPEPALFFTTGARELADVMRLLKPRGPKVDDVVLELRNRGKLDTLFRGAAEVSGIFTATPASMDPWKAIERLREVRDGSNLRNALERVLAQMDGGASFDDSIEVLGKTIQSARSGGGASTRSVRDCMRLALETALPQAHTTPSWGTGFGQLDSIIGGLRPGNVYLIGGITNWGKSYMLTALADHLMRQDAKPLIVSLEDEASTFGARLLARRADVNSLRLRDGTLPADDLSRATSVAGAAEAAPYYLSGRGRDVEAIAADVQAIVSSNELDCVFIDYVQKLSSRRNHDTRELELSYCNSRLSDLCKNLGVVGVFATQFTGVPKGQRPEIEQVKHCRAVAESCEVALFGYTLAGMRGAGGEDRLYVAKNKFGSVGEELTIWRDPRTGNFWEGPDAKSTLLRTDT